jgi:hypothetical protein
MVKRTWNQKGVIAPITAVLVVVLVVALLAVGYMAVAQYGGEENENQKKEDKDDDIIGRMKIDVKVKILNPDYSLGDDDDVQYTIDKVDATLIEVEPASILDIFDGMEIWSGEDNLKLTCKLVYDQSPQVLISPSSKGGMVEWEQEYKGTGTSFGDVIAYHSEDFYSGSLYYHGNYYLEITLYKASGDGWTQVDIEKTSVSI